MAIAPPVISLADTNKVNSVESSTDSTIGAASYFAVNVLYDESEKPYWKVISSVYLNIYEQNLLIQRYLTAGWSQVFCSTNDARTITKIKLFR